MNALEIRSADGHITTPLIGDGSVVHQSAHDIEHLIVKEEIRDKAWWLERHRQKETMWPAIWFVATLLEGGQEMRPKRVPASIDQGPGKVFFEYAIAVLLEFADLVLGGAHLQLTALQKY